MEPERDYSRVFFAFWLSHVPPEMLEPFLAKVVRSVRPLGHLFIVDQCDDLKDNPLPEREGIYEKRRVSDGRIFTIVKVYYHPWVLGQKLAQQGFEAHAQHVGESFFCLHGIRRA